MRRDDIHRLEKPPDQRSLSRSKWIARGIVAGFVAIALGSCAFWIWYPRQTGKVMIAMLPYLQNCDNKACEERVMEAHKTCRSQTEVPQKVTPDRRTPYDYCMQGELKKKRGR